MAKSEQLSEFLGTNPGPQPLRWWPAAFLVVAIVKVFVRNSEQAACFELTTGAQRLDKQ